MSTFLLKYGIKHKYKSFVNYGIKYGGDLDIGLLKACKKNNIDAVKKLFLAGAKNIDAALIEAYDREHHDIFYYLMQQNATTYTYMINYYAKQINKEILTLLFKKHPNFDKRQLLERACEQNNTDLLKFLNIELDCRCLDIAIKNDFRDIIIYAINKNKHLYVEGLCYWLLTNANDLLLFFNYINKAKEKEIQLCIEYLIRKDDFRNLQKIPNYDPNHVLDNAVYHNSFFTVDFIVTCAKVKPEHITKSILVNKNINMAKLLLKHEHEHRYNNLANWALDNNRIEFYNYLVRNKRIIATDYIIEYWIRNDDILQIIELDNLTFTKKHIMYAIKHNKEYIVQFLLDQNIKIDYEMQDFIPIIPKITNYNIILIMLKTLDDMNGFSLVLALIYTNNFTDNMMIYYYKQTNKDNFKFLVNNRVGLNYKVFNEIFNYRDIDSLELMLKKGYSLDNNDSFEILKKVTLNFFNPTYIDLFIKYGIDINYDDCYLIKKATIQLKFDVTQFLIERGAKLPFELLYYAYKNSHNRMLEYLLLEGTDYEPLDIILTPAVFALFKNRYKNYPSYKKIMFLQDYEYNNDSAFNENFTRSVLCDIHLINLLFSFINNNNQ